MQQHSLKAVIFDMDGVLVPDEVTWKEAEKDFITSLNKRFDPEIAKQYKGMQVDGVVAVMISQYALALTQEEAEQRLRQSIIRRYEHPDLVLLAGCRDLIELLHTTNEYKLAIASSSPKAAIEKMKNRFYLDNYFDVIASGEEVEHGKPAPDIFLHSAELLHIKPENCVVLEDSPHGIVAAKRAGMKAIAIASMLYSSSEDFHCKADRIVRSLEELNPRVIDEIIEHRFETIDI